MKKYLLFLVMFLVGKNIQSQALYFPPLVGNAWDTLSPATLGWCPDKVDSLFEYLEAENSKAFILLKDGRIVVEKYFGTFTQDSVWYWASAGKTLTAFMVGIAQQEQLLSISDTSSDYLGTGWTNCTPAQEEKITIRNQLTMTSGLDDGVPDHYCTLDTCLNYLADAGTRWAYHNGPYTLLDEVISNATGQTLNSYVTQKLSISTGITGAFFPSGYNRVFISKARSMARFGLLILNEGNWNGNPVLTDTAYFQQMVNTSQSLNESYGYLWWLNGKPSYMLPTVQFVFQGPLIPNAPNDMIAALGLNGQIINVVPSQGLVWIRMGNAPGVGEVPTNFNDLIWQKLNDLMCNMNVMKDPGNMPELKLYPNPATDNGTAQLLNQPFDLKLLDVTGRIVYEKPYCFSETALEATDLSNGIYYVQVTTANNQVFTRKWIVAR